MSKIYGQFHGGSSYAVPHPGEYMEEFDSIKEAMDTFEDRYHGYDPSYPTVDGSATMYLYFGGPDQDYPDRMISVGIKDRIHIEHC